MQGEKGKEYDESLTAGHALAWRGEWQVAAEAYKRAAALRPQDPSARAYLALALARLSLLPQALTELQAALERDPRNTLLLSKAAELQLQLGETRSAAATLSALADVLAQKGFAEPSAAARSEADSLLAEATPSLALETWSATLDQPTAASTESAEGRVTSPRPAPSTAAPQPTAATSAFSELASGPAAVAEEAALTPSGAEVIDAPQTAPRTRIDIVAGPPAAVEATAPLIVEPTSANAAVASTDVSTTLAVEALPTSPNAAAAQVAPATAPPLAEEVGTSAPRTAFSVETSTPPAPRLPAPFAEKETLAERTEPSPLLLAAETVELPAVETVPPERATTAAEATPDAVPSVYPVASTPEIEPRPYSADVEVAPSEARRAEPAVEVGPPSIFPTAVSWMSPAAAQAPGSARLVEAGPAGVAQPSPESALAVETAPSTKPAVAAEGAEPVALMAEMHPAVAEEAMPCTAAESTVEPASILLESVEPATPTAFAAAFPSEELTPVEATSAPEQVAPAEAIAEPWAVAVGAQVTEADPTGPEVWLLGRPLGRGALEEWPEVAEPAPTASAEPPPLPTLPELTPANFAGHETETGKAESSEAAAEPAPDVEAANQAVEPTKGAAAVTPASAGDAPGMPQIEEEQITIEASLVCEPEPLSQQLIRVWEEAAQVVNAAGPAAAGGAAVISEPASVTPASPETQDSLADGAAPELALSGPVVEPAAVEPEAEALIQEDAASTGAFGAPAWLEPAAEPKEPEEPAAAEASATESQLPAGDASSLPQLPPEDAARVEHESPTAVILPVAEEAALAVAEATPEAESPTPVLADTAPTEADLTPEVAQPERRPSPDPTGLIPHQESLAPAVEPQNEAEPASLDEEDPAWLCEWRQAVFEIAAGQIASGLDRQAAVVRELLDSPMCGAEALCRLPGVDEFAAGELLALPNQQQPALLLALARAEAFFACGMPVSAAQELEVAIVVAPDFLPGHIALGRLYERTGRHKAANAKYLAVAAVCDLREQTEIATELRTMALAAA